MVIKTLEIILVFLVLDSVLGASDTLHAYDDFNDGSTTDGSISILGDHEIRQSPSDADDLSTHTPSPQPLQMWMRCTPIDMAICTKRPLEMHSLDTTQPRVPWSNEIEGPNYTDTALRWLERFNSFLSSIYLFQVILLFLTAGGVAILAIIYSRYSACKLEIKDLEQKLYSAKMEKYQIEGNLAHCQYLYEKEVETATNVEFKTETVAHDKKQSADSITISTAHTHTDCQANGDCVIEPTRLSDQATDKHANVGKTVWTGAGDDLLATKQPFKSKEIYLSECDDESSLFSEYNRQYCDNRKNKPQEPLNQLEKVYSTQYSYKAIDDRECNPNKINLSFGIEHARAILREHNCDDEGTMRYLQQVYDAYQIKSKGDHGKTHKKDRTLEKEREMLRELNIDDDQGTKSYSQKLSDDYHLVEIDEYFEKLRKEHETLEKEKSKAKLEKTVHHEHSVITVGDENLSTEQRVGRNDKKRDRRDKKDLKDRVSDKENKRKTDRKDITKKHQQDKNDGKWNKNDRKRDTIKVHDHRHDD